MKIIEINVKNFGKLHDFSVKPSDGVNVFFGDNESGKSTLMAFVKSMFYGLGNGEKRRQYEPWQGGNMGGSIEFEHDGRQLVLNRTFGQTKAADKISLFNKSAGEEFELPSDKEPGAVVFGMNVKSFVNTVFIGQTGTSIEGENHEILARLTNLASAGDERVSKSEVEKNLKKGVAALDSKRSKAILPELRKQRHELLESRAEIQSSLRETDMLRDAITEDTERKELLEKKQRFLSETSDKLQKLADLSEIDTLIAKHDELEGIREKFCELDVVFNGENAEQISDFLCQAKELIEADKSQQIVIENKKLQLDEIKKSAEGIDRSKLTGARIINKYPQEIMSAFETYDALMNEKNEIEIAMESYHEEQPERFDPKLLIFGGAGIVLVTVLLGFLAHWLFFAVGAVALVALIAYVIVYKKGVKVDGLTDEQVSLNNVNEDLRTLNSEMRHIFEELDVKNMEEFDREYKAIETVQNQLLNLKERKNVVDKEISELTDELDGIRSQLRELLMPYHNAESNEEAYAFVSRLDELSIKYQKVTAELNAAQETFDFMLKDRSYDELVEYGKTLRGDITLELDGDFNHEDVVEKSEQTVKQLAEVSTRLIKEETELSLKPYSPQDMDAVTDEIKMINKRIEHYEDELDAINVAQDVLNEAFNEMQLDFGPMINYRAGRILSGFTGEKYTSVFVSEKLIPSVAEAGSSDIRNCGVLSTGTFDQVYLSLRLALSGVMSDEKLPVFLDDAFAQFDDERMEKALDFINEDSRLNELGQIMLFTCHKRVLEAAERIGIAESTYNMSEVAERSNEDGFFDKKTADDTDSAESEAEIIDSSEE